MLSSYRVYPLRRAMSLKLLIRLCSLALEQDTSLNTYVQPTSRRLSTPVPLRMCCTPMIPGIPLLSPKAVGARTGELALIPTSFSQTGILRAKKTARNSDCTLGACSTQRESSPNASFGSFPTPIQTLMLRPARFPLHIPLSPLPS
jgi:hypothetical protein